MGKITGWIHSLRDNATSALEQDGLPGDKARFVAFLCLFVVPGIGFGGALLSPPWWYCFIVLFVYFIACITYLLWASLPIRVLPRAAEALQFSLVFMMSAFSFLGVVNATEYQKALFSNRGFVLALILLVIAFGLILGGVHLFYQARKVIARRIVIFCMITVGLFCVIVIVAVVWSILKVALPLEYGELTLGEEPMWALLYSLLFTGFLTINCFVISFICYAFSSIGKVAKWICSMQMVAVSALEREDLFGGMVRFAPCLFLLIVPGVGFGAQLLSPPWWLCLAVLAFYFAECVVYSLWFSLPTKVLSRTIESVLYSLLYMVTSLVFLGAVDGAGYQKVLFSNHGLILCVILIVIIFSVILGVINYLAYPKKGDARRAVIFSSAIIGVILLYFLVSVLPNKYGDFIFGEDLFWSLFFSMLFMSLLVFVNLIVSSICYGIMLGRRMLIERKGTN